MKRIKWIIAAMLLSGMVLGAVSCTNDNENGFTEVKGDSTLSPEEHKEKLDEIATGFINSIDANSYRDFFDCVSDFPGFGERDYPSIDEFAVALQDVVDNRSAAAMLQMANSTADLVYSLDLLLKEMFGEDALGFEMSYNTSYEEWAIEPLNERVFLITWFDSELRVDYSAETTTYRYDCEEDELFGKVVDIVLPNEIKVSLTSDGTELASLYFKPNLSQDNLSIQPEIVLNVVNLTFKASFAATPEYLKFDTSFSIDGNELTSMYAKVLIDDFTDPNDWIVHNEWSNDFYLDPEEEFIANVKTGEFRIRVLTAELRGEGNIRNLIEKDESDEEFEVETKEQCEELAEFINNNINIELVYTDENLRAAVLRFQVATERYNGEEYYYVEPVIVFGDGSRVSIASYLENPEEEFEKTADAFENLIDDFYRLMN